MAATIALEHRLAVLLGTFVLWGCGDDLTEPQTGTIEITSTTSGERPDADGYTVTIDGGAPLALGNNATLRLSDVTAGDHQLELSGMAPNCATNGANPLPVAVPGGGTTPVSFQVECPTPSGSIRILTVTQGDDPDADGYDVTLDGGSAQPIGSSGSLNLTGIMPGEHRIQVHGVAPNCELTGGSDRSITVGTAAVELSLDVVCRPAFGTLVISIEAIGIPDPDRFTVTLDDATGLTITSAGSLTIPEVRPGDHQIELSGLAHGCVLQSPSPQAVRVTANASTPLRFVVACTSTGLGTFLFNAQVGDQFHIFRLARDGTVADLTPTAQAEQGRLSPDGTRIVFTSARSGTLGIWVMNADGSRPVRLTNNGEVDPEWSPDGSRIVFWPYVTVGFGTVTVMNADGGDVHDIGRGSEPNWSSTGRIAVERAEMNACIFDICALNIYTMKEDGTDVVQLTRNAMPLSYAAAPTWSPDGSRIAFYSSDGFNTPSLRIMNADGASVRTIISSRNFVGTAVWSPDGRSLAYAVTDSGVTSRILVQPVEGGRPALILQRDGLLEPTSWVK